MDSGFCDILVVNGIFMYVVLFMIFVKVFDKYSFRKLVGMYDENDLGECRVV